MSRRARSLARDEGGFTLVEMLVVTLLSTVVVLAAYSILDSSSRSVNETQRRTEATQRGRAAMEVVTRTLRGATCSAAGTPPVAAATPTSVDVYADLSGASVQAAAADASASQRASAETRPVPPSRYRIALEGTSIRLYTWTARWSTPASSDVTFTPALASTPTPTTIVADVQRTSSATPLFRYYGYAAGGAADGPTTQLGTDTADVPTGSYGRVARFAVNFAATPVGGIGRVSPVGLSDDVTSGTVDPADSTPTLECSA